MKQLSDRFNTIYKERINESNIYKNYNEQLKKILMLFGYGDSYDNWYLRQCENKSSIIDIHKFNTILNNEYSYIMCIERNKERTKIYTAILYKFRKEKYNIINNKIFKNIKTINEINDLLNDLDENIELVLKYE